MPTDKLKITFYADDDVAAILKDLGPGERSRRINELIRRGLEFSEEATDDLVNQINTSSEKLLGLSTTVKQMQEVFEHREEDWAKQRAQLTGAIGSLITKLQSPEFHERVQEQKRLAEEGKKIVENAQTRQQLAQLVAQLKPKLNLQTIQNADQTIGAFLLGYEKIQGDAVMTQLLENQGKTFLEDCLRNRPYDYMQLGEIINSIAKLNLDWLAPLAGRIIGILLQADYDARQNPALLAQYDAKAKKFLS